jgi:chaperonin cofactor prefoldin
MVKQEELIHRAKELVAKKDKLSQRLAELKGQEDAIVKTLKSKGIKIENLEKQVADGEKKLKAMGAELSVRLGKAEALLEKMDETAQGD